MKEWQKGRGEKEWVWVRLTDFWSVPSPPPHHPASPPHHTWKMFESWEMWTDDCIGQCVAWAQLLVCLALGLIRRGMEGEWVKSARKVGGKYEEGTGRIGGG